MVWILPKLSNYQQVAPSVRTGGSRHTGLAAPPHRNIHMPEKIVQLNEYSGRFYTPIPEIGNHRSDMKETAIPF